MESSAKRLTVAAWFICMTVALAVVGIACEPDLPVDCAAGARTQSEIDLCAAAEADRAKNSLDVLLEALAAKLSASAGKELQAVQEDWSRFVDHQCRWEASMFEGGSIAPTAASSCRRDLTKQRIDVLKRFLCAGAGMTGPCEESKHF